MFTKQLITLFLLFAALAGRAADPVVDSLKEIVNSERADSVRLEALLELSRVTFGSAPDTAIAYAEAAGVLAGRNGDSTSLAYALKNVGLAYYVKGDYFQVLDYWQRSLEIFEAINDPQGVSNLTSNLGAVYFNQGDEPKALDYYLRSLRVSERIDDSLRIATALINIGAVYAEKEETHDQALEYYRRALAISEAVGDPAAIGTSAVNLGELNLQQGQLDQALSNFQRGLEVYEASGGNTPYALYSIGKTYAAQGELNKALDYHERAYTEAERRDARLEMSAALLGQGEVRLLNGQTGRAIQDFENGLAEARRVGSLTRVAEAYEGLTEAYARQSDFQQAYAYQTLLAKTRDTLYSIEKDERLQGLRFTFEIEKKESQIELLNRDNALKEIQIQRAATARNVLVGAAVILILLVLGVYYQYWYSRKKNRIISEERNRSERILLNILPEETAEELKKNGSVKAKRYESATVLFTDFKSFTKYAEHYPAEDLVKSVDYYFRKFDEITGRYRLEKIKTIGDSYMCVGGLPIPNETHPFDAIYAGFEIAEYVARVNAEKPPGIIPFEVRIGISTGPVVSGVVGTKKFQYDIWGTTVNTASRMETNSEAGRVNISTLTYELVKDHFECTYRGKIKDKNGVKLNMYFVDRPTTPPPGLHYPASILEGEE